MLTVFIYKQKIKLFQIKGLIMQLAAKEREVATLVEDLQKNNKHILEMETKYSGSLQTIILFGIII